MKYFDRIQKIIALTMVITLGLVLVFLIINTAGAKPIYDENEVLVDIEYPVVSQALLSVFIFLHIAAVTWFIARSITIKMRLKEAHEY